MNLLITTLGTSWQIVPELFGITNPAEYDFFSSSENIADFRRINMIFPVDELWVVTTEGQHDLDKLEKWAKRWNCNLRIFICKGVNNFQSEQEIIKMRSFIYRVVLYGSEKADILYLSLSGGRKTMSADMQEAGNLFGCDAMLHVVDIGVIPEKFKNDDLLSFSDDRYPSCFIPILVNHKIEPNLIISADNERIKSDNFPLDIGIINNVVQKYEEDCTLFYEIQKRKERSSQVYTNFYNRISNQNSNKRDLFRKLYFLHPDKLEKLKTYSLGKNSESDYELLKRFPKAELHSHLGGVLSPFEIIQVAKTEENYKVDIKNPKSQQFKNHITEILRYENKPIEFEKKIYGKYFDDKNFFSIGIDEYQKLGDFQGSSLLQTEKTISKTIEIYADNLIEHNVKYVEIRCSPYKYTKLGLSIDQVVDCMTDTLKKKSEKLEYRFIYIIGRQSSKDEIKEAIQEILNLMEHNSDFKNKLVGIDLAGNEGATKPSELREDFMPLLEKCVNITIHAGETESVDSIWEAVYHLSADRIGHGLKLLDNEELLNRFINKNIGIEMCPSSNYQIVGFDNEKKYPLYEYMNRGLKVSINTDDQGISKTNLTKEFITASKLCPELTLWDFIVLIRNSISIAFCDSKTKNTLMHSFEDEILNILQEIL